MKLFEAKDIVREHLARTTFPTVLLDEALTNGRRIVEQTGNFYWMRAETFWQTEVNRQHYPIYSVNDNEAPLVEVTGFPPTTSTLVVGIQPTPVIPSTFKVQSIKVPNFKDIRFCFVKPANDVEWSPCDTGGVSKEEAELHYAINENGMPELIILDNSTLLTFPPFPDQNYVIKMLYFKWTDNPTSNRATDEILSRFPYALIYAALSWAYEMQLKDQQGAMYWKSLLGGPPQQNGEIGNGGEIAKIRRHNFKREQQDKVSLIPMTGPYQRVRRLRITQNIWLGSGGSL